MIDHEPCVDRTEPFCCAQPDTTCAIQGVRRQRIVLTGDVPSPVNPPSGCAFHPRCPKARLVTGRSDEVPESCSSDTPELAPVGQNRLAACWYPIEPGDDLQQAP